MRNRRRRRRLRKVYCVLVEGHTERWYIDAMRRSERFCVRIKPDIVHQIGLNEVESRLKRYFKEGYDKIFWIVDMDTYWNKEDKFHEVCNKIKDKVEVLINNPCLEVWFLAHFTEVSRNYPNCMSVINELKRQQEMTDYEKNENFFQRQNIYQRLKPYLNCAIARAKELDRAEEHIETRAQIYKLIESIKEQN